MILGIDHTQITVPKDSEPAAREFYQSFLGLKEIEKPENRRKNGGFWMEAGAGHQVHVGLEDGVARDKTKAHVAYLVDNLEHWRAKCAARGIAVQDSPPFPDKKAFEFRDPFGNRVELIQNL